MNPIPLPSQSILRELLEYDPRTGILLWKPRASEWFKHAGRGGVEANSKRWSAQFAGKPALNSVTTSGYLKGRLIDKTVLAHRVAFKWFYGVEPDQIDHINGSRSDNRIDNLRSVTVLENQRNRCIPNRNKSGRIGVCWATNHHKWKASIKDIPGSDRHLGFFDRIEDAIAARSKAEIELGYHPNHGRVAVRDTT